MLFSGLGNKCSAFPLGKRMFLEVLYTSIKMWQEVNLQLCDAWAFLLHKYWSKAIHVSLLSVITAAGNFCQRYVRKGNLRKRNKEGGNWLLRAEFYLQREKGVERRERERYCVVPGHAPFCFFIVVGPISWKISKQMEGGSFIPGQAFIIMCNLFWQGAEGSCYEKME